MWENICYYFLALISWRCFCFQIVILAQFTYDLEFLLKLANSAVQLHTNSCQRVQVTFPKLKLAVSVVQLPTCICHSAQNAFSNLMLLFWPFSCLINLSRSPDYISNFILAVLAIQLPTCICRGVQIIFSTWNLQFWPFSCPHASVKESRSYFQLETCSFGRSVAHVHLSRTPDYISNFILAVLAIQLSTCICQGVQIIFSTWNLLFWPFSCPQTSAIKSRSHSRLESLKHLSECSFPTQIHSNSDIFCANIFRETYCHIIPLCFHQGKWVIKI
jgi:hypothetical protein